MQMTLTLEVDAKNPEQLMEAVKDLFACHCMTSASIYTAYIDGIKITHEKELENGDIEIEWKLENDNA